MKKHKVQSFSEEASARDDMIKMPVLVNLGLCMEKKQLQILS